MFLTVSCTVPNPDLAKKIAQALVEEELAACVQILPGMTSIYRWEGKIIEDTEVLLLIKTKDDCYPNLEARIKTLHPYKVPEIAAIPIQLGEKAYLTWIEKNTK